MKIKAENEISNQSWETLGGLGSEENLSNFEDGVHK